MPAIRQLVPEAEVALDRRQIELLLGPFSRADTSVTDGDEDQVYAHRIVEVTGEYDNTSNVGSNPNSRTV